MRLRALAVATAFVVLIGGSAPSALAARQSLRPTIKRTHAYGVQGWGAVLLGSVDPNGLETVWYFQMGKTRAYGLPLTRTSLEDPLGGHGVNPVEEGVLCLAPKTTYHFRLVAKNAAGKTYGHDQTFTTKRLQGSASSIYGECPDHGPLR
jgi:hypothetical protein